MKRLIHEQILKGTVHDLHLSEPEIFADHEKAGRSGHLGHGMTEFAPGKIIDFYPNCSGERFKGHTGFGWMEYRISEDWGKTFGKAHKFPLSRESFLDGLKTVAVEKAVTTPDGTILAFATFCSTENEICWEPYRWAPVCVASRDGGKTWEKPVPVGSFAGRLYDVMIRDGVVYVLHLCNDAVEFFCATKPEHVYRLFRSTDGGKSFEEVCVVPFPEMTGRGYGNMTLSPKGELIVYAYNNEDEFHMDYAISPDMGLTWTETGKSYVAKRIRNPQVGILDGQYILHGRAGENGSETRGCFVFYTSADGLHWDEGKLLVWGRPASFYSNNLTIRFPDGKERMLVQYSENYENLAPDQWGGRVNDMHLWLESLD